MKSRQDRDDEHRAEIEAMAHRLEDAKAIAEDAEDHRDFYAEKLDRVGKRLAEICEGLGGNESAQELTVHLFQTLYELDEGLWMAVWANRKSG